MASIHSRLLGALEGEWSGVSDIFGVGNGLAIFWGKGGYYQSIGFRNIIIFFWPCVEVLWMSLKKSKI